MKLTGFQNQVDLICKMHTRIEDETKFRADVLTGIVVLIIIIIKPLV